METQYLHTCKQYTQILYTIHYLTQHCVMRELTLVVLPESSWLGEPGGTQRPPSLIDAPVCSNFDHSRGEQNTLLRQNWVGLTCGKLEQLLHCMIHMVVINSYSIAGPQASKDPLHCLWKYNMYMCMQHIQVYVMYVHVH